MKLINRSAGITLIEILFATILLGLCFYPIFALFKLSHGMGSSGKKLNQATRLANNLMSGVKTVDPKTLKSLTLHSAPDENLVDHLALESLGVQKAPEGFNRFLTLEHFEDSVSRAKFKRIHVDVKWLSSFSKQELSYRLSTLMVD